MASTDHARIKQTPPTGVIIPNCRISVIAKRYKLPENKIIPDIINQADSFIPAAEICVVIKPIKIKPRAW